MDPVTKMRRFKTAKAHAEWNIGSTKAFDIYHSIAIGSHIHLFSSITASLAFLVIFKR